MLAPLAVTLGFLPLYLLIRAPFWRLPLHIDTGFYVSNHTISAGRIDFSKGWNARFAGCSKVLPEFFYSLIYLLHCRRVSQEGVASPARYKYASRAYASIYNYATAIALGLLAHQLAGGDLRFYYAGLAIYALLSSEPQYGVYFECGELFGNLSNVVAFSMFAAGLQQADTLWIAAAVFIWAFDAFFVKLSSVIALTVMCAATLWIFPSAGMAVLIGGSAATALYFTWLVINGQHPWRLIQALARHETSYGQRMDRRTLIQRAVEKVRCLARTVRRQPLIPLAAVVGAIIAPTHQPMVWVYFAAVVAAYCVQAADCWYYQIPLLPVVALLATGSIVFLTSSGPLGVIVISILAALWIAHNTLRAAGSSVPGLNQWCWNDNQPPDMLSNNLILEEASPLISSKVAGRSLLVYGPFTQAYILSNAAYPTSIVCPEYHLDEMYPDWQRELSNQLVATPPAFVLDTSNSFDAAAVRRHLGLDYRLTDRFASTFRLLELPTVASPTPGYEQTRSFNPQTQEQLSHEEDIAGSDLTIHRCPATASTINIAGQAADGLSSLLQALADNGYQRLAVYGAGRFTMRHAEVYRRSPVPVVAVLDDKATGRDTRFLDWPLRPPADAETLGVDAVVVSTDRFTIPMLARARQRFGERIAVFAMTDAVRDLSNGSTSATLEPRQRLPENAGAPRPVGHTGPA